MIEFLLGILASLIASVIFLPIVGWLSERRRGKTDGGNGAVHYFNVGLGTTRIFVIEKVVIKTIETVKEIPVYLPTFPKFPRPRLPEWTLPVRPWRTPEDDQPPIERRPRYVPERRPLFGDRLFCRPQEEADFTTRPGRDVPGEMSDVGIGRHPNVEVGDFSRTATSSFDIGGSRRPMGNDDFLGIGSRFGSGGRTD